MDLQIKSNLDTAAGVTGILSMAAVLPHRAYSILSNTKLASTSSYEKLAQLATHQGYGKFIRFGLAPVGLGLSLWNAYSALDRITSDRISGSASGDAQSHLADWLILGSSICGAAATFATFTPAAIPVAGVLGTASLVFDLLGVGAMLFFAEDGQTHYGEAALQLGLTLAFGFDPHHYKAIGKGLNGEKGWYRFFLTTPVKQQLHEDNTATIVDPDINPKTSVRSAQDIFAEYNGKGCGIYMTDTYGEHWVEGVLNGVNSKGKLVFKPDNWEIDEEVVSVDRFLEMQARRAKPKQPTPIVEIQLTQREVPVPPPNPPPPPPADSPLPVVATWDPNKPVVPVRRSWNLSPRRAPVTRGLHPVARQLRAVPTIGKNHPLAIEFPIGTQLRAVDPHDQTMFDAVVTDVASETAVVVAYADALQSATDTLPNMFNMNPANLRNWNPEALVPPED